MHPHHRQAHHGPEEYAAFHPVDRESKRMHIRPGSAPWFYATSSYLQYIAEDAGRGRVFNLIYGFLVVEVRGRNLQPVVHAIARDCCEFIQQFDLARWKLPEPGTPVIESIICRHPKQARIGMAAERKEKRVAENA